MDMKGIVRKMLEGAAAGLLLATLALPALAQTALQDIRFSTLPGAQFEIRLGFNAAQTTLGGVALLAGARIVSADGGR